MKDHIAKQAYDRGYDAGARAHREAEYIAENPYQKTRSLRTYSRHDYWQMGCDDGWAGRTRKMSQSAADELQRQRMAQLEDVVRAVAVVSDLGECPFPGCKEHVYIREHAPHCPVTKARALVGDGKAVTA